MLVLLLVAAASFSAGRQWDKFAAPPEASESPGFAGSPDSQDARIELTREPATPARDRKAPADTSAPIAEGELPLELFQDLHTTYDSQDFARLAGRVRAGWRPGYAPILVEIARFSPTNSHRRWVLTLLEELTGERFGGDFDRVWHWVWAQDYAPHPEYGRFKADLYKRIDDRFESYFDSHTAAAAIRLDEVRWGGVYRDGIPPLKNPEMVAADSSEAGYLEDSNVVFGIEINGDARAYPKRILAWHEMFKDALGPEDNRTSINGVYCTLCGSMIVYDTVDAEGTHHELGTSGFLYRSNKLMYDHKTESMWNTITGEPVIGPLVGKGIKLKPYYVVTTTWGEWKRKHPETTVLSLETGHRRDYGEGVAYRDYFGTDELMFAVPKADKRLKNKAEILALRFGAKDDTPTVIDASFLADNPVYQGEYAGQRYVVLTDKSGANRIYAAAEMDFSDYRNDAVASSDGRYWNVTEAALVADDGQELKRLAAHRAFWFGWHAAHPDTELIK